MTVEGQPGHYGINAGKGGAPISSQYPEIKRFGGKRRKLDEIFSGRTGAR